MKIINTNQFVTRKEIAEEEFDDIKENVSDFERPILGTFTACERHSDIEQTLEKENWQRDNYRIVKLKDGKLRAETQSRYYSDSKFSRTSMNSLVQVFMRRQGVKETDSSWRKFEEYKLENINMPEEVITQAKDQVLIGDI